jgi:predicted enzyme related to lactoylglutathione lyase
MKDKQSHKHSGQNRLLKKYDEDVKHITMDHLFLNSQKVSVRYIVNDVGSCVNFYSQILGFTIEMNPPAGFAMLSKGNLILLLNEPGAGGAGQSMPDGAVPNPGGWNRIQLQTSNIALAIDQLKKNNVKFRNDVVTANAGKQILLMDPSGNLIELFEATK